MCDRPIRLMCFDPSVFTRLLFGHIHSGFEVPFWHQLDLNNAGIFEDGREDEPPHSALENQRKLFRDDRQERMNQLLGGFLVFLFPFFAHGLEAYTKSHIVSKVFWGCSGLVPSVSWRG